VEESSLVFTYCQVPVVYQLSGKSQITVALNKGSQVIYEEQFLDTDLSKHIFTRSDQVEMITVDIDENMLQ
jgi:hypothetical protein